MKRVAVLLVTLLAGCDLYSHGGDDVVCNGGGYAVGMGAPEYQVRDPSTGICSYNGGGGGGGGGCSYDSNGCCQYTPVETPAQPAGSYCSGGCEGLDENTCSTTYGCHAAYASDGAPIPDGGGSNGTKTTFEGCWDIQPLTPIEGGDCTQLDAWTCAQHDDCVSIFGGVSAAGDQSGYGYFESCAAEGPPADACAGIDCGPGATCETQCYPCDPTDGSNGCMSSCGAVCVPDQTCASVDCGPGYTCAETCDAASGQCYPSCYPSGPTDPGSCTGAISCETPTPACPANTVPGIENGCYTGFCIPLSACGPADPGSCDKTGVTCAIAAPACPANTVPGVTNGCWSGFCIPTSTCPVPACETVTDEATCQSRSDCEPVYDGQGCTCTPDGACTCQSESFARCETIVFTGGGGSGGTGSGGMGSGGPVPF